MNVYLGPAAQRPRPDNLGSPGLTLFGLRVDSEIFMVRVWLRSRGAARESTIRVGEMPIVTVKQLCTPSAIVTSDKSRIGVVTHPRAGDVFPSTLFDGEGLVMSVAFNAAYEAAEAFSRLYAA